MSERFDVIVLGAGHNGLVAAAYLAGAGLRTLVLERRPVIGGACVTEELLPGHRFSTASYVCSLLRPEVIRDLDLRAHGLDLIPFRTTFTPFPDGSSLLLGGGDAEDARQIARFSARDAEAYPRFNAALARVADVLRPALDETPPSDPGSPGVRGALDMLALGRRYRALSRADRGLLLKVLTMSAADLLDEWFESAALKATLGPTGTIGTYGSPRTPGTAFILLHYVLGEVDGARGAWAFARGGMGSIAAAIAGAARARGARLRLDAPVERILVAGGAVRGVGLAGGEEIGAPLVVSNADPKRTFLTLVERGALPPEFVRGIENLRCRGNSAKVNLALARPPDFTALPGDGEHLRGTIQITGATPEYVERAFAEYASGSASRRPFLDIVIPSLSDATLAPPGRQLMSISVKFVPYLPADGAWDAAAREALGDRVIETLETYAPGLGRDVVFRQVLTPVDFEERFGLTGGNICHGEMALDQLFTLRPLFGWARYRTPVAGLYLCGAGTHPGGGVMGAAGRNAARAVLADSGRGRGGRIGVLFRHVQRRMVPGA